MSYPFQNTKSLKVLVIFQKHKQNGALLQNEYPDCIQSDEIPSTGRQAAAAAAAAAADMIKSLPRVMSATAGKTSPPRLI